MARLEQPGSDAELCGYLLAEAVEFRRLMVETLLNDASWAEYAWRECSKRVDQLAGGGECRVRGYELPDEHPMRVHGPHADLVLGADDVVRFVS